MLVAALADDAHDDDVTLLLLVRHRGWEEGGLLEDRAEDFLAADPVRVGAEVELFALQLAAESFDEPVNVLLDAELVAAARTIALLDEGRGKRGLVVEAGEARGIRLQAPPVVLFFAHLVARTATRVLLALRPRRARRTSERRIASDSWCLFALGEFSLKLSLGRVLVMVACHAPGRSSRGLRHGAAERRCASWGRLGLSYSSPSAARFSILWSILVKNSGTLSNTIPREKRNRRGKRTRLVEETYDLP